MENTFIKLEIVIESIQVNAVTMILESCNAMGYTIIGNISGKGENGMLDHNCKAKVFENTYIFTVCSLKTLNCILPPLKKILEDYSGFCFTSKVDLLLD
jgi:nitrogen regulatory protein PII